MREVLLKDTMTGEARPLEAGPDGSAGIYACGPTTYGPIHIGNARPYVVFSVLARFLAHEGYSPSLVINLTASTTRSTTPPASAAFPRLSTRRR